MASSLNASAAVPSVTPRDFYVANFVNPNIAVANLRPPLTLQRMTRVFESKKTELDPNIAPVAKRTAQSFKKKVRVVYKREDAKIARDRLRWKLTDGDDRSYTGQPLGGMATGHYVMFLQDQESGFKVIPVRKWINFKANQDWTIAEDADERTVDLSDAKLIKKLDDDDDAAASLAPSSRFKLLKKEEDIKQEDTDDEDEDAPKASAAGGRQEGGEGDEELDYDEEVDDDVAEDPEETKSNTRAKYGVGSKRVDKLDSSGVELTRIFRDLQSKEAEKNKKPPEKEKPKKVDAKAAAASNPASQAPLESGSVAASPPMSPAAGSPSDQSRKRSPPPEEPASKRVKVDSTATSTPTSPISPSGGGASLSRGGSGGGGDHLLTELEVRTYLQAARPTQEQLLEKFKPRLKQNKENKRILKELITSIAKQVPGDNPNTKVLVLKGAS